MPPVNALPLGGTAEDRIALALQRIEKKKQEEQTKPPPPPQSGDKAGQGGAGGAKGTPEAKGDDYQPPANDADQRVAKQDHTTGAERPKVREQPERQVTDDATEQRRTETHLAEGRPVQRRAPAEEEKTRSDTTPSDALPTYQQLHDRHRRNNEAQFKDTMDRQIRSLEDYLAQTKEKPQPTDALQSLTKNPFRDPLRNGVDCRDCHPDKKDDLTPLDFSALAKLRPTERVGPKPVNHDAVRAELDRGFESTVQGMSPVERAEEAQRYSDRLAADEMPQARKFERDFRLRESNRLQEASRAKELAPESRERMQQLAHDLVRRPMSEGTQQFISQLEQTPVSDLSHRDSKAALSTIRAHRPADANTYDPVTGVQPGHDDLFYSREEQARLFDPAKWEQKQATVEPGDRLDRFDRRNIFANTEKCYDCHPDKKTEPFSLSSPFTQANTLRDIHAGARERLDTAIDNKIRTDHPSARKGTEQYDQLAERYRDESALRFRLELSNGDPRQRLKIQPEQMTAEQRQVYDDHVANFRLKELDKKIRPHHARLDSEYTKNGWGDDSPFYGVDREAFLADVAGKEISKVSSYDRFRALSEIDGYKRDNGEQFDRDPNSFEGFRERVRQHEAAQRPQLDPAQLSRLMTGEKCYDCHPSKKHDFSLDSGLFGERKAALTWKAPEVKSPAPTSELYYRDEREMRAAGLEESDIRERMKSARAEPNNPIPYLKKSMDDLSDAQHQQVSEDYTRFSVEQLEGKLRKSLVGNVGKEVDRLDRTFDRILREQGVVGDLADAIKNNLGSKDGWLIDSELGSNAVVRTIHDAYRARRDVESLANFKGSHEEFVKAYRDRVTNLNDKIQAVPDHIQRFQKSQSNWVEGISDFASVGVALTAAAAVPFTGGASLLVGAAAGAVTKVGTKGLDAWTGSGEYDGNVALDLFKGGINGLSATGTNMLARQAAQRMLANQATKLATGQSVSMLTRAGIWGGTTIGEGAVDGYIVGTSNSLLEGKSLSEANMNGLRGAAFGAILNPLSQGATNGLGRLWRGKAKADVDAPAPKKLDAPERAKLKPSTFADDILKQLDVAGKDLDRALDQWPHTGKQAASQKKRIEGMAEDVRLAKKLVEQNPTDANASAAREFLSASEKSRRLATEYGTMGDKPKRPPGRLSEEELAQGQRAKETWEANEKATRQAFMDEYKASQQAMYESIRKTAGIEVSPISDARPGAFDRNPVEEVKKLKLPDGEKPNRAYAELEVDGVRQPIGPRRSGGGPDEGVRGNPYEAESRVLEDVPGQHKMSRMNDSEVRLMGLVHDALSKLPKGADARLRIFTELPPCPSCQRVMSKFRTDYPNVQIEVFHQ